MQASKTTSGQFVAVPSSVVNEETEDEPPDPNPCLTALPAVQRKKSAGHIVRFPVQRAAILSPETEIGPEHLVFNPPSLADRVAEGQIYRRGKTLREVEIDAVRQALQANDYNQKAAARELGIARSTLIHKIEKYDLAGLGKDDQG